MSQQIAPGQPMAGQPGAGAGVPVQTTGQKSPVAISVGNFLRDNKILKQRTGLLNNKDDIDFFRYKRYVRALTSDEYKKKQANPKNGLPPIANDQEAAKMFVLLIQSQMVIPVKKLHFAEIKQANKGWKANRTKPTLVPSQKANLEKDSYFAWTYTKPNPYMLLYGVLTLAGIFAVILFPLWPNFMKRGVWYLSMACLGLIGLFFGIAIVRLIIYVITFLALPRAFWLYPNLFADCGVLESFQPLYGWEEPKKPKAKKGKKNSAGGAPDAPTGEKSSATSSGAHANGGAVLSETLPAKRKVILEEVKD